MHSLVGSCFVWKDLSYRIDNTFAQGGTASLYSAMPYKPAIAPSNDTFGTYEHSISSAAHCQDPSYNTPAAQHTMFLALKLIGESFAQDRVVRERFMREGELLCRLSHPNLVKGYAVGEWQERPFFIMERIEGATIAQILQFRQQIPPREALAILRDILSALCYLSLDGRVSAHRDIKPSNIMLDTRGNAKLIDLGIAKTTLRVESELDTRFLGSFHYVAPEQIDNAACVDIRADIYALGAVFFEMCAGKRAFSGENSRAVLASHLAGTIPALPKTGVFAQDKELWRFCSKILQNTLALDCLNRFQTPSEFLAFLEGAPAGKADRAARFWNPQSSRNKDKAKTKAAEHSSCNTRYNNDMAGIVDKSNTADTSQPRARHILTRIAAIALALILLDFLIHRGQESYLVWKVHQEAPPVGAVIGPHKTG